MQNINELIGIIKGISFDNIVSKREIERLQSWVDKNRNLAYDKKHMQLISIVDHVLNFNVIEEHVISVEERDLLFKTCDDYISEHLDDSSIIYELNGIIEGILCDGELNKKEIICLKEWMDSHENIIKEHRPSAELCNNIYKVLDKGEITIDNQAELLDVLNTRISISRFENKLDYLCKRVKEKKNIGTELIDILNNESAMQEIHQRAEKSLFHTVSSYSGFCMNPEIIVVSLVLIAMLEYDGNYYDSVRETYKNIYSKFSEQKVEGTIRSILSRYKNNNDSSNRIRIINVALENAIVPKNFLPAFFEFIFDIYKLNFEYDLPEELYEDFQFVYEGLRNSLLSEGDELSINITQKTYKLISSTKQLITREDGLDALIKLSIIIVRLIDKRYWNKEIKILNPYLKNGYEGWEKTLNDTTKDRGERKNNNSELRSKWEPKYKFINNQIYLDPPSHRIKAQYDYRDIIIVVFNNGEEIYKNNQCDIREIIGGYQINPGTIILDNPLGEIVYRLMVGDEIIYDSKDKLYRKFIVFNNLGQEISNNTDYEGTAYIAYKEDKSLIERIYKNDHYSLGYKLVRNGDAIEIGNDVFNFSTMTKPGVFGQRYENCYVQDIDNCNMYPVYHDTCFVAFEADSFAKKYEIDINGHPHKLSDMQYKATEKGTTTKYVVDLNLKESGVFDIEVNLIVSGSKNKILHEKIAFDNNLNYSKEMTDDSAYLVHIDSELLKQCMECEISAQEFDPAFVKFDYEGTKYSYYVPFDFGYYSIFEYEWSNYTEDLWIDDIRDRCILKLYDSECDSLWIYTENGTLAEDDIKLTDRGYYKEIPIFFLNSYKEGNKFVTLVFLANGKAKYVIRCYNKCIIDEDKTEVICWDNPKRVEITPIFHGKNKVFYELFNSRGEKLLTSKLLDSGETSKLLHIDSFKEYTIQFHEKPKLLQLRKNTLLYETKRIFYAKEDFAGKRFKIEEAYYNDRIRYIFLEKQYHFNRMYVALDEETEPGIYKGRIIASTKKGWLYLDNINPVKVELCSDVIDETMDIYIEDAEYGEGLLLDFKNHGILNNIEDPKAPDIFLYTISLKGEY